MRASVRLALACSGLLAGCGGVRDALQPEPVAARAAADDLVAALADRFGPTTGPAAYTTTRDLLLKHAFAPSRLLAAPLWQQTRGATRAVAFAGAAGAGSHYRFELGAHPATPAAVGASRTTIVLTDDGDGAFVWQRRDELAVGRFGGDAASRGWAALLRGLEAAAALRQDPGLRLRRELPRTARALGRALTLHSLDARRDGTTTLVSLGLGLEPAALAASHPRYARFLAHYLTPMRGSLTALDESGHPLLSAAGSRLRLALRFRVGDGRLLALGAPFHPAGQRFALRMGFATRSGLIGVGLEDLRAIGEVTGGTRARLALSFGEEPRWLLPFFVRPFLRKPLRHPFAGEGSHVAFAFAAADGGHLVARDYRFAVRETWVTRWLGGLMSGTLQAFRRGAEAEAEAFVGEAFVALREDLLALR